MKMVYCLSCLSVANNLVTMILMILIFAIQIKEYFSGQKRDKAHKHLQIIHPTEQYASMNQI